MKRYLQRLIPIIASLMLAGCPLSPCGDPGIYNGTGVVDSNGIIHVVFGNRELKNLIHIEKDGHQWKREEVVSLPGELLIWSGIYNLDGNLCFDAEGGNAGLFRGCRSSEGVWTVRNRVVVEPGGDWDCDYWTPKIQGYDRTVDGKLIFGCTQTPRTAFRKYDFFIADDIKGEVLPYFATLDAGEMVLANVPSQDYNGYEPWINEIPFYDSDAWDAASYIVGVAYWDGEDESTGTTYLYYVYFDKTGWHFEKIHEQNDNWLHDSPWPGQIWAYGLETVIFKGKKVTMVSRQAIVKKDTDTGKVVVEPLDEKYIATYKAATAARYNGRKLDLVADVVTSNGKLHAFLQDKDEDETVLYYYVYNPDSPTPEVPETIERLDSVGRR